MMPSSSQVLDHQLIFHIMYGVRQFHHRQNKGGEERGELAKKQQLLNKHREEKVEVCINLNQQRQLLLPKHRG
jgi:hypothetical protein